MIKQSQIRNFISLIARKNLQTTALQTDTAIIEKNNSNKKIERSKRYETEPINDQTALQNTGFIEYELRNRYHQETKHQYIKLSLYQKYRRSLQDKKKQLQLLQTQCLVQMDKQTQNQRKTNQVVFPVSRPAERSHKQQHFSLRHRILSTPSHPLHCNRTEKADEGLKRLPSLSPEQLQGFKHNCKPMFKVSKYQPLNFQTRIDHMHKVLTQEAKSPHQRKMYAKLKLESYGRIRSKKRQAEKTGKRREAMQQSLSGWMVDKCKSRCDYET